MIEALSETGNPNYYDCTTHIGLEYWGWKIPDISELRDPIILDYDISQKVYEEIKERPSSTNVNIRLYAHLKARGYDCEMSDFKTLSDRDSLEYHDRMLRMMKEKTGINFPTLI